MTYPTASKLRYCLLPVLFVGWGYILAEERNFDRLLLLSFVILVMSGWMTFVILKCPVCFASAEKSKSGFYIPWVGPRCRHCDSDLSSHQISFQWLKRR